MKKLSLVLVLTILMSVLVSGCGGQGANQGSQGNSKEQTVLRMSCDHPIDHMAVRIFEDLSKEIEEKTDGRYKIDLYPVSQLGEYTTVYPEIARGTIDIAAIPLPVEVDQRFSINSIPYLVDGYEQAKIMYASDGYLYQTATELNKAKGVKFLGYILEGFVGMGTKGEPNDMWTPGTDKKMKMRVWSVPGARLPIDALGFTSVTIPYNEVSTAMQTGVCDGWIGGSPNVNYHFVGEIIDRFYMDYMIVENCSLVMNEKFFNSLTPEDQQIFTEACANATKRSISEAEAEDMKWLKKLEEDLGVTVIDMTPEQTKVRAEFVRENVWPELEQYVSKEIMDGIKAELEAI